MPLHEFIAYKKKYYPACCVKIQINSNQIINKKSFQGAKKIVFAACHSGKLKVEFTSPDVILTSPKTFLTSKNDFTVLLLFQFLKKHRLPIGQTEFTSPIAKSTSPRLSDTTFFCPLPLHSPWRNKYACKPPIFNGHMFCDCGYLITS